MKSEIIIDKPCSANWDTMCKTDTGRYCAICATNVVDFTNMSVEEIDAYFKTNSSTKTCGRFQSQHVRTNTAWHRFLNTLESKLSGSKFKAMAIAVMTLLMFLSSCRTRRRTMGSPYLSDSHLDVKTMEPAKARILDSKGDVRNNRPLMGRYLD
jgi:hypothetical protein